MPLPNDSADDIYRSLSKNSARDVHTPLPLDSANPVYPSILTKNEMAEISTRKVRILLPSETARRTKATLAEMATKKMSVTLPSGGASRQGTTATSAHNKRVHPALALWLRWYSALKKILPVYVAVHLALIAISCLAFLYTNHDFASKILPVSTLWTQWHHWDTGYYLQIATHGYTNYEQMAFFPFYPILERMALTFIGDTFTAGMLVSNLAELLMFTALYRLVEQDFGVERAFHTVLYFAIFPAAFFFSIAYTESTFLCLSVLTFYQIRRGHWWPAALFGFLACLTRPDGMFLTIPFCYEYLRRKWPQETTSLHSSLTMKQIFTLIKSIRFDILICLCIPVAILCVMVVGREQFGDPLAFFHAHAAWGRHMAFPGYNILVSMWAIYKHGIVSFTTMRTLTDLLPDLMIGLLILLCFVGEWRLPPKLWSYGLYALVLYLYFQLFIKSGVFPLESMSRFLLEIFPAFILLSTMRRNRLLHLSYFMVALALFFFLSTQFATGHWVL